ncbi:copper chaperone PCu(A)C [Xanthobacteraceae bacterium Astr-EGSB]|uniref:copper chaperone PCu(A)C n=1 Tax=Astrobacterium formosum TaxID=3069710 RepID=UPI0027AFA6CC|nr:copper chaperone PCu(A)C [Xanthobacteraceae bacterium Astr-EGSB]
MSSRSSDAVVLLGRGMPHGEQWATLATYADRLRETGRFAEVRVAFLEMTEPALADVLAELEATTIRRAVVLPCFVPFDRNVAGWLGRSLAARRRDGRIAIEVVMAPAVDRSELFAAALSDALDAGLAGEDVATALRPLPDKRDRGEIPPHRDQVFVCLGPRCTEAGAWELMARLRAAVKREGLDKAGPARTLVCRSACLWPCNQAPVMIVQPDNVWYGRVTSDDVDTIVQSHLVERVPVAPLLLRKDDQIDVPADWPLAGATLGSVTVSGFFARVAMHRPGALAVFGTLACSDDASDLFIAASSPIAGSVALHSPDLQQNATSQAALSAVEISPGHGVTLKPGGLHLMLLDVRRDLLPGESFPLALCFERAGVIAIDVTLQPGA